MYWSRSTRWKQIAGIISSFWNGYKNWTSRTCSFIKGYANFSLSTEYLYLCTNFQISVYYSLSYWQKCPEISRLYFLLYPIYNLIFLSSFLDIERWLFHGNQIPGLRILFIASLNTRLKYTLFCTMFSKMNIIRLHY